jgi:2-polyprenyl-6-methoxyphenol hydroxylase-like FAD-dependent oxidoreductase
MMLWPNATRVLRELGLLERVRNQGGTSTHFQVRSSSGRVLMNLTLGNFDVPAVCIRRADLLSILQSELPPDRIHLAHEFQYMEQSIDTVRVHFKGGIIKEHNAVIGADGIRSRVRSELFGPWDPLDRGYTVWRGMANYDGGAIEVGTNSESWGFGKRFGILSCGENRYTWYATGNVSLDHVDASCGRKSELREAFAGWHEPIISLIDATADDSILKHRAFDIAPLPRWGQGKITLLGDAAHPCTPNLGQGACMALEDALVLAQCASRENSVETALRRYEQLRRSRTAHIQQRSLLMGQIGQWQNPLFVMARNAVTSLLPSWPFERNLRTVYSYVS